MTPRLFGRKIAKPFSRELDVILVPMGAANSRDDWALGEALHMFCVYAQEQALFAEDELPADAVSVFRAYEFANDLSNWTISGWFQSASSNRPVAQTVTGLELIGADSVARILEQAGEAWEVGRRDSSQSEPMDRFRLSREQEESLVGLCSQWVRSSPRTVILGDGAADAVYKETMKRLYLCNPEYPAREAVQNDRRARLGLTPSVRERGALRTLEQLIAEVKSDLS